MKVESRRTLLRPLTSRWNSDKDCLDSNIMSPRHNGKGVLTDVCFSEEAVGSPKHASATARVRSCGPATSTRMTAGETYWNPSSTGTRTRTGSYTSGPTPPSPRPRSPEARRGVALAPPARTRSRGSAPRDRAPLDEAGGKARMVIGYWRRQWPMEDHGPCRIRRCARVRNR